MEVLIADLSFIFSRTKRRYGTLKKERMEKNGPKDSTKNMYQ